jgi:cysteine-rich repeat protein
MNKSAQAELLIIPGVIALVAIALLISFFVSSAMRFTIIGIGILAAALLVLLPSLLRGDLSGESGRKKLIVILIVLLVGVAFIFVPKLPIFQQATLTGSNGETVRLAIPVQGSYGCLAGPDKLGLSMNIPATSTGALISSQTVGFYSNGIKNIKLKATCDSIIFDRILTYQLCDKNGNNCGSSVRSESCGIIQQALTLTAPSVDFNQQSIRVTYSGGSITGMHYLSGATITYDATPYYLAYASSSGDILGAPICSTSCDLTCADIGTRDKLQFVQGNILGFGQHATAFEYWNDIDYDLNAQGGATVYNSATNKFCLAGAIYTGAKMKMASGTTYIYPDTNTRQNKPCCPGATISSTYSDKVCQSDYTWKTIQDTDKLTCISDFNCPAQGGNTCQNKILSGYHCTNKDTNNVGVCVKENGVSVSCCLNSDCNNDMVCDLSSHTCKGGTPYPTCGDGILQSGEQCDDGNTISGDSCSSSCQIEKNDNNTCNLKCSWYSTCQIQSSEHKSVWSYITFGLIPPTTITTTSCVTADWIWWIIVAGVILIFLILILLLLLPKRTIKKITKRK